MKRIAFLLVLWLAGFGQVVHAGTSVLFVGNSFTYGAGSAAMDYRPELVRDLNEERASGMPALFKAFTIQLGLDYDVSLETAPNRNLDWHWFERRAVLGRSWDAVVMQGYSVLDAENPGDAARLTRYADLLAGLFRARNPQVELNLLATWSRADQTYTPGRHWFGRPITAMGQDLQRGYEQVGQTIKARRVISVGLAWNRAMETGLARSNPYDPAAQGINLWSNDSYHASAHGTYLEALVVLGALTGCDPRLGDEPVARELNIAVADAVALQQVAWESLPATKRCSK